MLRVAVVGVGWAGTRHVAAIRELGRKLAVECLVDPDAEHLAERSAALGVEKTYTDFSAALRDPAVDAVSICAPHAAHAPLTAQAAEAGKHVLCEKPIALTVADATRMIDAARANGVRLYVAENVPYGPVAKLLRDVVRTGRYVGEVTAASIVAGFKARGGYGYPGRRAWLSAPEQGGTGTWMLHGIHTMAGLRNVFGEAETVYMREHKAASFTRQDVEGTMSGLVTMASGVSVSVVQTCETRIPDNFSVYEIHGDRGSLRATKTGWQVVSEDDGVEEGMRPFPVEDLSDYAQEMEAFADYVAGAAEGPTTGESERRTLAIVEAGYESARTGVPVNLRARFGEL